MLDFGSQYTRLIARRIREGHVYSEILPHGASWSEISRHKPAGIILSGGPASVYGTDAPRCAPEVFRSELPILGICYGLQLLAVELGGGIEAASRREYGPATLHVIDRTDLFRGLPDSLRVWMSHGDRVTSLPDGFHALAHTDSSPWAAISNGSGKLGIQFHPEVVHTSHGTRILGNFAHHVCGAEASWTPKSFVESSVASLASQIGKDRVILALSGGVDSTVAAALLSKAVGDRLICVFVDSGLLRLDEGRQLLDTLQAVIPGELVHVDASNRFLKQLEGIVDPEEKRRIIGHEFIHVFSEQAQRLGDIKFLAQGTLYPDVIESAGEQAQAASKIKTHHNVGGLPRDLRFCLVEPLRYLFKDEVREVGRQLGLPDSIIRRQPFPGPGLAVRIIGEVTPQRLELLRLADRLLDEEIRAAGWYDHLWQSFAVLTPVQTVGVMGDYRTYTNVLALRAVTSEDAMTADWARLPHELLGRIANRIVNEIPGINRVVYDITPKPPATIEWE